VGDGIASELEAWRAARASDPHAAARIDASPAVERVVIGAAARLPASESAATWVHEALAGAHGADAIDFALAVVVRASPAHAAFVDAFVSALAADVGVRGRLLERLSTTLGAAAVYDALTRATERGALTYRDRRFVTYYVRGRPDDDPIATEAAYDRLVAASAQASDAPPGVRRAGWPRPR
jgi:hypothetical protein